MSVGGSLALDANTCQQAMDGVGSGVAASLYAVDCAATATAQAAFGRLFGTDGALLPVLTVLLTLFVAFFAFALITGRTNIGIASLTPRMMTLGLVLTFATSWIAYQSVVWNLAVGAPDEIASLLMGTKGSATRLFAERIDVVFTSLMQADNTQAAAQGGGAAAVATFSPPGLMWLGATLLLLGTVGVLATTRIALAVLLALGPVFVVLALFPATRGLFTGWLKGVIMLALAPLFAVLGGTLMLDLSVPVLRTLVESPNGQIDPRAAMAFFVIGAVHLALMIMVMKVAGTMVAGWKVFGLAGGSKTERTYSSSNSTSQQVAPAAATSAQPTVAAPPPSREIRLSSQVPAAANDSGQASGGGTRETRIVSATTASAGNTAANSANASLSRARGIGSRFRASTNRMPENIR